MKEEYLGESHYSGHAGRDAVLWVPSAGSLPCSILTPQAWVCFFKQPEEGDPTSFLTSKMPILRKFCLVSLLMPSRCSPGTQMAPCWAGRCRQRVPGKKKHTSRVVAPVQLHGENCMHPWLWRAGGWGRARLTPGGDRADLRAPFSPSVTSKAISFIAGAIGWNRG